MFVKEVKNLFVLEVNLFCRGGFFVIGGNVCFGELFIWFELVFLLLVEMIFLGFYMFILV